MEITISLPKGFMNCIISDDNYFYADTNEMRDSINWDTLRFPLPKPIGKWVIKNNHFYHVKNIILIDDYNISENRDNQINRIIEWK